LKSKDDENFFLKQVKSSLDRGEENIDAGTLSRLHRIRQEAIYTEKQEKSGVLNWLPFPALATAAVVLLTVFLVFTGEQEQVPNGNFEDLEILASNNLEFYEDLDFYAWLAEEQPSAG
jgi:hypothetical protein